MCFVRSFIMFSGSRPSFHNMSIYICQMSIYQHVIPLSCICQACISHCMFNCVSTCLPAFMCAYYLSICLSLCVPVCGSVPAYLFQMLHYKKLFGSCFIYRQRCSYMHINRSYLAWYKIAQQCRPYRYFSGYLEAVLNKCSITLFYHQSVLLINQP